MRDQFLRHYGIPGMRWGVRKRLVDVAGGGSSKSSGTSYGTGQRRMSNKELKSRITRLRLEKEYKDLTTVPQQKTVSKMEKVVKSAGTIASLSTSAATIYKNLNALGVIGQQVAK